MEPEPQNAPIAFQARAPAQVEVPVKRLLAWSVAIVVAHTVPAFAQADDTAYCAALSALASKYLVGGTSEGRGFPSPETRDAIIACQSGNTAAGIPVLEKKLRASGFTLPKR